MTSPDQQHDRAQYRTTADGYWTDMPEAEPRARCRVTEGSAPSFVRVKADGSLEYDKALVEIDTSDYY